MTTLDYKSFKCLINKAFYVGNSRAFIDLQFNLPCPQQCHIVDYYCYIFMYIAIKSCTLKAHTTYLVTYKMTSKQQDILFGAAFWLGLAVVAFVYFDIALDILAN